MMNTDNSTNMPLVTVMMPVYNGISTLPLAIASLKNQTYSNWKCVIVNDGSTDGTKEYLDNISDPRFIIVHFSKNKGRPYARQAALDVATGEYLAFLDADDFYHPQKIELQVSILEQNKDIALISCGMGSFNNRMDLITVRCNYDTEKAKYTLGENYTPARAAAMIRLPLAQTIRYNLKLKYAQDTDYFVRYLDGRNYLNIESILYYYSEFQSVTKLKVLKTKYYGIFYHATLLKRKPLLSITRITVNMLKIMLLLVSYPFIKDHHLLTGRGKKPILSQCVDFENVKQILSTNTFTQSINSKVALHS